MSIQHHEAGACEASEKLAGIASWLQNYCDQIAPILWSIATILLTSLLLVEAHALLTGLRIWHDPGDLCLAYVLPTIFITVFFGSNIGVWSALASGLAGAYFIYPPQFSVAIDTPGHMVELGLFLVLFVTASKSTAILRDENPLNRRPARKLSNGERSRMLRRRCKLRSTGDRWT
jgi:K+-sensing histidine kinase KdpD